MQAYKVQPNKKQMLKYSTLTHQQNKQKIKDNFLTIQNNCEVIQTTSEIVNGQAQNIMTSNQRELWVTQFAPPQYVIIDVEKMILTPDSGIFNYVGFYCWYDYETNPALIEILVKYTGNNNGKSEDFPDDGNRKHENSGNWITVAKIRLQMKVGWQQFKLANEINLKSASTSTGKTSIGKKSEKTAKLIKIQILQNFGDQNNTYLNQVSFGYVPDESKQAWKPYINSAGINPIAKKNLTLNPNSNQSTKIIPLTSTEKQLKKSNERIRQLQIEQQKFRQAIINQNHIISQMQVQMQRLIEITLNQRENKRKDQGSYDFDQRQRTQSTHQKNQRLVRGNETTNLNKFHQKSQKMKTKSRQLGNSKEKLKQQYLRNPFTKKQQKQMKENQNRLSNIRVTTKHQHQNEHSHEQRGQDSSDSQSLSAYSKSPKPNKKYISMLQKLQTLIAIRDQKKKQLKLKSGKKSRQKQNSNSRSKYAMSAYSKEDSDPDY